MGGGSGEREVSLKSGKAVQEALEERNFETRAIDVKSPELEQLNDPSISVAFIALHGSFGENGTIQETLQHKGIPYTGSGPAASRYGMDKIASKKRFREADVPTFPYHLMEKGEGFNVPCPLMDSLDYGSGMVVKPRAMGSSIGIRMADEASELPEALEHCWEYDDEAFIEPRGEGPELTVGILKGRALPVIQIEPEEQYFNYNAKYEDEGTNYLVNPSLPESLEENVKEYAVRAFEALECSDFARVDFILHDGTPYALEVNTIPGMTPRSLLPMAAEEEGISFPELCEEILSSAVMRAKF